MSIKNTRCNAQSICYIKYITCAKVLQDFKSRNQNNQNNQNQNNQNNQNQNNQNFHQVQNKCYCRYVNLSQKNLRKQCRMLSLLWQNKNYQIKGIQHQLPIFCKNFQIFVLKLKFLWHFIYVLLLTSHWC